MKTFHCYDCGQNYQSFYQGSCPTCGSDSVAMTDDGSSTCSECFKYQSMLNRARSDNNQEMVAQLENDFSSHKSRAHG